MPQALIAFLDAEVEDARKSGVLFSLHMKVSDTSAPPRPPLIHCFVLMTRGHRWGALPHDAGYGAPHQWSLRVGSKLPLPIYADVRHSDDSS